MSFDLFVCKFYYFYFECNKIPLSISIVNLLCSVYSPLNFYPQPGPRTIKIHDVAVNAILSNKLPAEFPVSNFIPQDLFCWGRVYSKLSTTRFEWNDVVTSGHQIYSNSPPSPLFNQREGSARGVSYLVKAWCFSNFF